MADLYTGNIMDEPLLSDAEKVLLFQIQYKCRLSKEASTESNTTIGIRAGKGPDRVNSILGNIEKKGFIKRVLDLTEKTQRRIELTPQTISLITKPFKEWYFDRVGVFNYPPLSKRELEVRVSRKELEELLPMLIQRGMIKD